ncbi:MAG: pre-peptidase C-terminal domain-containing protein [Bacteroidales bacterium]|nr:pre-peptidase C-terminal domain-containing protein [Bacteroidales bacterium]
MKTRLLRSILPAAALFLAFSCAQEEFVPDTVQEEPVFYGNDIIRADLELSSSTTRTALESDSSTVVWSKNDAISMLSSTGTNSKFTLVEGVGATSASFAGTLEGTAPYTALYPYAEEAGLSGGSLVFKLPHEQTYESNSFGIGASPMVAYVENESSPLQFRNLCGMVCIKLQAKSSPKISKIVIRDLGGNMLWGNCVVAIDGKQGTSEQTMSIIDGTNEVVLNIPSGVSLLPATPKKFYIAVPAGSFDRGFSVSVYDNTGALYSIFQTQNPSAKIERSMISNMVPLLITPKTEPSNPMLRGYYKDLFMNGGLSLTSRTVLPACPYIGWDYEFFATQGTATAVDTAVQKAIFTKADDDLNGYLLYPDRAPRFRVFYCNGGNSREHGKSLAAAGRKTIYDFVYNGGGYVGTCAGAFIACKGYDKNENYSYYTKIFPGHMYHTGISKDTTDMAMPADCPLRRYFTFGETVNRIYHNGGGYMSEAAEHTVAGTEILLRYTNCPSGKTSNNGKVSGWAYKPNNNAGRMVLLGSHPEGVTSGERRDLFAAMLMYAADGHGDVKVKTTLEKGVEYDCSQLSSKNTPLHARIGDKQYHHFKVSVPAGAENIRFELASEAMDDDLYLSVRKADFAWFSDADYTLTGSGTNKELNIKKMEAGDWYVSVYAPNTVTATLATYDSSGKHYKYTGDTSLLDGIPYSIKVDWD